MRRTVFVAAGLLAAAIGLGDGGRVRLRQDAGPFAITVFSAPDPLTAGPADLSVLVQEVSTGAVILDAAVELRFRFPGEPSPRTMAAVGGTNRLLESAVVELDTPGDWSLEVSVRRGSEAVVVSCVLPVGPRASRAARVWPYVAAPPLLVTLFAATRRRGRRSRR